MAGGNINSNIADITAARDRYPRRHQEIKLSKEALTELKSELESSGKSTDKIDALIANFDKIDVNGDGISSDEYKTYTKTGLPSGFADRQAATFTKEDLVDYRDKLIRLTGRGADGLNQVISDFDNIDSDSDGVLSQDELKTYASENGIKLPLHLTRKHFRRATDPRDDNVNPGLSRLTKSEETAKKNSSAPTSVPALGKTLLDYLDTYGPDGSSSPNTGPASILAGLKA